VYSLPSVLLDAPAGYAPSVNGLLLFVLLLLVVVVVVVVVVEVVVLLELLLVAVVAAAADAIHSLYPRISSLAAFSFRHRRQGREM
jgi:hypothetical protein